MVRVSRDEGLPQSQIPRQQCKELESGDALLRISDAAAKLAARSRSTSSMRVRCLFLFLLPCAAGRTFLFQGWTLGFNATFPKRESAEAGEVNVALDGSFRLSLRHPPYCRTYQPDKCQKPNVF